MSGMNQAMDFQMYYDEVSGRVTLRTGERPALSDVRRMYNANQSTDDAVVALTDLKFSTERRSMDDLYDRFVD